MHRTDSLVSFVHSVRSGSRCCCGRLLADMKVSFSLTIREKTVTGERERGIRWIVIDRVCTSSPFSPRVSPSTRGRNEGWFKWLHLLRGSFAKKKRTVLAVAGRWRRSFRMRHRQLAPRRVSGWNENSSSLPLHELIVGARAVFVKGAESPEGGCCSRWSRDLFCSPPAAAAM